MCHIVAKWVPYYLNEVQQWIYHETCHIILKLTSSTFTHKHKVWESLSPMKLMITVAYDIPRCCWRLILFNKVRLSVYSITSHIWLPATLCSYGEKSGNSENVILHVNAIVHLAHTVKNCLAVGDGKFYSTLPVLLTSVHTSVIWFLDCMGSNIQTRRTL